MEHVLELLGASTPFQNFVFQPAMFYVHADHVPVSYDYEGVAILSRHSIVDVDRLFLSRDVNDVRDAHQRVVLRARVATPHGHVDAMTAHFALSLPAQKRAVGELQRWLEATERRAPGVPQLLAGDLNALPTSLPIRTMLGEMSFVVPEEPDELVMGDFVDLWREWSALPAQQAIAHGKHYGATFPTLKGRLHKRIDYLLVCLKKMTSRIKCKFCVSLKSRGGQFEPLSFELLGSKKENGVYPSDHVALLVHLKSK